MPHYPEEVEYSEKYYDDEYHFFYIISMLLLLLSLRVCLSSLIGPRPIPGRALH